MTLNEFVSFLVSKQVLLIWATGAVSHFGVEVSSWQPTSMHGRLALWPCTAHFIACPFPKFHSKLFTSSRGGLLRIAVGHSPAPALLPNVERIKPD